MEILKKYNIEFLFLFFFNFRIYFCLLFSDALGTSNKYFAVPFRMLMALVSIYIIYKNFDNLKKKDYSIFCYTFWIFYLIKAIYSFNNDTYLPPKC